MSEKATQGYKSRVEYAVTDTSQKTYSFPFQYLKKKFVKVQKRDSNKAVTEFIYGVDYTVTDLSITLMGTNPLAISDTLIIYRETDTTGVVTWTDASILLSKDMSLEQLQNLHLIEEAQDYLKANAIATTQDENNITVWDALDQRITNVADPVDTQDAVTKHYMESVQDGFVQRNQAIETHVQQMQTDVTQKQQAAAQSASNAATSETNAAESEANALASEEAALASEQAAATSETNAAESEDNAKTSETNAKTSETNAKTSETNAKTSELNAASSETNAAASESAAAASETNAANSELMAQKWAESPTSPDGQDDTASDTGKTQSSKEWAKQAERAAQVFQDFTGATATEDGTSGKVIQPKAGDQNKILFGGGVWGEVSVDGTPISPGSNMSVGNPIMSASVSGRVITFTRKDGSKFTITTQDTVTTNTSNWSVSKGAKGWARDNSTGFTIQWGTGNMNSAIKLARSFTSALTAVAIPKGSEANTDNLTLGNLTTTTVTFTHYGNNNSCTFIALGFS